MRQRNSRAKWCSSCPPFWGSDSVHQNRGHSLMHFWSGSVKKRWKRTAAIPGARWDTYPRERQTLQVQRRRTDTPNVSIASNGDWGGLLWRPRTLQRFWPSFLGLPAEHVLASVVIQLFWHGVMMGVWHAWCFFVGRLFVVRPFGWVEGAALRGQLDIWWVACRRLGWATLRWIVCSFACDAACYVEFSEPFA